MSAIEASLTASLVVFNLLLNGVVAFVLASLLVQATARVLRVPPGRAHVALLLLPFAKLAVDVARGVPDNAFLWQRAAGVARDLGSFQMGLGVEWFFLKIHFAVDALAQGARYTDSAPDMIAGLLMRKVGTWAPLAIAASLLVVGAVLSARRWTEIVRAARFASKLRAQGELVERPLVRGRVVPVFVSDEVKAPFSGGVLRPYVAFPRALWASLTPAERGAALAHELAHVAEHHVAVVHLVGLAEDVFWFVPGISAARRALRGALELAADARAIASGHAPLSLASALVRVGEASQAHPRASCAATGDSLAVRFDHLLNDRLPPPRLGCHRPLVRALVVACAAGTILTAITFGNH